MKRIFADVPDDIKRDFAVVCAKQGKTQREVLINLICKEIKKSKGKM